MTYFFTIYGVLAIGHIFFQMLLGHKNHKREKEERKIYAISESSRDRQVLSPNVAVFVPVYNEEPAIIRKALESLLRQNYSGKIRVFVVDDGSTKNSSELWNVFNEFVDTQSMFLFTKTKNQGKRMAQYTAMNMMIAGKYDADIIVTVDSDTVIQPDGITEIVKPFKNDLVGAATGHVMVTNTAKNLLTELVGYRYWMAFNQERAAQSYFKVLMCCSGPFSAFRANAFISLAEQYTSQIFLGKECTYGDDRHLTNLFLEQGWNIVYTSSAKAYTQAPETIKQYVKQQVRWNKSFYREMLWTLKSLNLHHWYLVYDLTMQLVLPFLLMAAIVNVINITFTENWLAIVAYLAVMVLVGLFRVTYAMFRTGRLGFLKFLGYGLFHVMVLVPVRFYAIATIRDGKWLTR